ncbi:MAG: hypothetical protein NZ933_06850 [Bacteroidia bacterium]|nr:hypothetical protein [Bacteroidia bacterium]
MKAGMLFLVGWMLDTLLGVQCKYGKLEVGTDGACIKVWIKESDRQLLLIAQERQQDGRWLVLHKVCIDRWSLPKEYSLCVSGEKPGRYIRFVLQGIRETSGIKVLYEGYPWGAPTPAPAIEITQDTPPKLNLSFFGEGNYLLRCYNRFGEEIFTIPIEARKDLHLSYAFPKVLRGIFLIRLYEVGTGKVITEKPVRL